MINYNINIDVQGEKRLYTDIELTSGDTLCYKLEFSFYNNGSVVDLSDKSLTVKAKRFDGRVIIDSGTVQDLTAFYIISNSIYAVEGELCMEIALVSANGEYLTTKELIMNVREGFGSADITAQNTTPVLVALMTQASYTRLQGDYAKEQGDYAKSKGDIITADVIDVIDSLVQKPDIVYSDTAEAVTINVENNSEFRFGTSGGITLLDMPSLLQDDEFYFSMVFSTGAASVPFNYSVVIKWLGDDINNNGYFIPDASKRYNLLIWWDGFVWNGIVSGVELDA